MDRIVELQARLDILKDAFRESEKEKRKYIDGYKVLYGEYERLVYETGNEVELRDITED